jgi:hypothetical protein
VAQSFGLSVNISNLPSEGRQLYLTLYGYARGVASSRAPLRLPPPSHLQRLKPTKKPAERA